MPRRPSPPEPPAPVLADAARRVRALRTRLGLSQEQLAQQLQVSFATVNRWEGGRHRMSAGGQARFDRLEALGAGSLETPADPVPAPRRPALADPPRATVARSTLIGRQQEIGRLTAALAEHRLVTIVGPVGAGKTRLAADVGVRTGGAVATADLRGVRDPDIASERIDRALDPTTTLLVADGVEGCTDGVRRHLGRLLDERPRLHVLATGQHAVGLAGERLWPMAGLSCPQFAAGAAAVVASEAGLLFVKRAHEAAPGFSVTEQNAPVVAEICAAADGLPLAIEVLAGWVGTLSVQQIAEHAAALLYPAGSGQGSVAPEMTRLDDAAAASYALVDPAEQDLLAALAAFAGSFTLTDAARIAGRDEVATVVSLRRLVDSSWLVVEPGPAENSYRMSPALRPFAERQQGILGVATAVRSRHARHFAELAVASEDGLLSVDRAEWVSRMTKASSDVDVALTWALDAAEHDLGLAMSAALWLWWLTTGRLADGRRWLGEFLKWARDATPAAVAGAWCAAAVLEVESGDYPDAIGHASKALAGFEALDDLDGAARAATALGSAERYLGHRAPARRYFAQAMNFRRTLGDDRGLASALNNMALLALDDGDLVEAARRFEESLRVKRRLSEPRTVAIGLANLSDVLIRLGQVTQALDALREAASIAADLADLQLLATIESNLGDAAASGGDHLGAVEHFETSLDAYRASGGAHDLVPALCGLARALHALGRTHEAVAQLREAEALSTATDKPDQLARIRSALSDIGHPTTIALPGGLTARQAEILRALATGASNKQIAESLHISVTTVERHLATIYPKLGLRGRVEATRYALKHGLAVSGDADRAESARSDYMVPRISSDPPDA